MNPLTALRRRVYLPCARIPPGRMVELPGRGVDVRHRHPRPGAGVAHHRPAARARLHRAADLVPLDRAAVAPVPRGHPGPALARAGASTARTSPSPTAPTTSAALIDVLELERGHRRGLLDGLHRGPTGLAAAPRQVARTGPVRDHRPLPDDHARARVLHRRWRRPCWRPRTVSRSRTAVHASRAAARALDLDPVTSRSGRCASSAAPAPLGGRPGPRGAGPAPLPALAQAHRRARPQSSSTANDHVIPADRQLAVARAIPGATIHDIETGHAACVLETESSCRRWSRLRRPSTPGDGTCVAASEKRPGRLSRAAECP